MFFEIKRSFLYYSSAQTLDELPLHVRLSSTLPVLKSCLKKKKKKKDYSVFDSILLQFLWPTVVVLKVLYTYIWIGLEENMSVWCRQRHTSHLSKRKYWESHHSWILADLGPGQASKLVPNSCWYCELWSDVIHNVCFYLNVTLSWDSVWAKMNSSLLLLDYY